MSCTFISKMAHLSPQGASVSLEIWVICKAIQQLHSNKSEKSCFNERCVSLVWPRLWGVCVLTAALETVRSELVFGEAFLLIHQTQLGFTSKSKLWIREFCIKVNFRLSWLTDWRMDDKSNFSLFNICTENQTSLQNNQNKEVQCTIIDRDLLWKHQIISKILRHVLHKTNEKQKSIKTTSGFPASRLHPVSCQILKDIKYYISSRLKKLWIKKSFFLWGFLWPLTWVSSLNPLTPHWPVQVPAGPGSLRSSRQAVKGLMD